MRNKFIYLMAASVVVAGTVSDATAEDANDSLVEEGRYIARAADCMSCHIGEDGEPFAGGKFIETPLGNIMATNITPSAKYGIGKYSEDDLKAVLRNGKARGRKLYPAMPYPSYHTMTDADITALYAYLRTVEPVEKAPQGKTDLDFPFNIRPVMYIWNAIAIDDTQRSGSGDAQVARGEYLVDTLGHCGDCHTPRNALMMPEGDRYLGGAMVQGWHAPNLTSDPISGLGNWRAEDIAEYLKTGHAMDTAQAAGPMAEAIHFSTSHLKDEDLMAMALYLKTVPALETEGQSQPVTASVEERVPVSHTFGSIREELAEALAKADMPADEKLFLTQCAACHGVDGSGQTAAYYPALKDNGGLRRANAANLINVIAHGSGHSTLYRAPVMPGFSDDLNVDQMAEVANYVRTEFGGQPAADLTGADVDRILNGKPDLPFIIRYAAAFAWLGILVVLGGVVWIFWAIWRRRNKKTEPIA